LWVVAALAVIELAVLIAQNAPDRHAVQIPGYHKLMVVMSALICVGVVVGFLWRPTTWPCRSVSGCRPCGIGPSAKARCPLLKL
jgi:hypothetical protein